MAAARGEERNIGQWARIRGDEPLSIRGKRNSSHRRGPERSAAGGLETPTRAHASRTIVPRDGLAALGKYVAAQRTVKSHYVTFHFSPERYAHLNLRASRYSCRIVRRRAETRTGGHAGRTTGRDREGDRNAFRGVYGATEGDANSFPSRSGEARVGEFRAGRGDAGSDAEREGKVGLHGQLDWSPGIEDRFSSGDR